MMLFVNGGTKTVYAMPKSQHLGVLFSPNCGNSIERAIEAGLPWACDNGAYSGFQEQAYRAMVEKCTGHQRHGLRWIVCPDVVGDHRATLNLFDQWAMYLLRKRLPIAFVAQDGCTSGDVPWEYINCLFIGGTTSWKLGPAAVRLIEICRMKSFTCHVGRVNSYKRLKWAFDQTVTSVDGTSMSRFSETYVPAFLRYVTNMTKQTRMSLETPPPPRFTYPRSPYPFPIKGSKEVRTP